MIAYFSMEIGFESGMRNYAGGLGVLAGDTIRSAADMKIPMVAVTLLYRKGYFWQKLNERGEQIEEPAEWNVADFLTELPERVPVKLEGRTVQVRAWRYLVRGLAGYEVPIYFLDTDLEENSEEDRRLSHFLYGGDDRYRLSQEVILGIGGVKMLRKLGFRKIGRFHMNEGHSSLLVLELLDEALRTKLRQKSKRILEPGDLEGVREKCVFTTHTPVPAGHDQFPFDLAERLLGKRVGREPLKQWISYDGVLNMTYLALNFSGYINGVAKKHGEISQQMFSGYTIDSITNGIHAATWASSPFGELFDRRIPGWRQDNASLRNALGIAKQEIWEAHQSAKRTLLDYVKAKTSIPLSLEPFTIGFARRAAAYKRADLVFYDLERLKKIAQEKGGLQLIFAGKAHPQDGGGKGLIQKIFEAKEKLKGTLEVVYLPDYDIKAGKIITAGVDLWLNNPEPPLEASGTSGMKAALNGVPSLSTLDGWWMEGHVEGVTGWAIGEEGKKNNHAEDAASLYFKLEEKILPFFYHDRDGYLDVMRNAIALNGSFFNTQRMLQQYVVKAYFV